MVEDPTILDLGGYAETYCDEIAEAHIRGQNATLIMTRWKKIDHVWRRVVANVVVKPVFQLNPDGVKIAAAVAAAGHIAERLMN